MKLDLPLDQMSVADKLQIMEAIWDDLSRHAQDQAIPEWHQEVLAEREKKLAEGTEQVLDWETAKKQLRREINETKNP